MARGFRPIPNEVKTSVVEAMLLGDSAPRVAETAGVSERSVKGWKDQAMQQVRRSMGEQPATELVSVGEAANSLAIARENAKKSVAERVDAIRKLYLDRAADPDAIAKTSGFYAVLSAKHLTEVHQLLTGGATHRVEGLFAFLAGYREGGDRGDPSRGEG